MRVAAVPIALGLTFGAAACGSDGTSDGRKVTLVAYDSFPVEGTPINDALTAFTAETGVEVEILIAGDTGTMLSKATLTAGNPEGDVMWGVDNTFLSRAIDADVFDGYAAAGLDLIPDEFKALVPNAEATPVDFGDVCINYDIGWFAERNLPPPSTLADLVDPAYEDLLVVQNPATSSPGLAFVLATIDEYGSDGWKDYWTALVDNGVEVVDGWTQAYYERFSWSGGGPRPMVVSYGSSPPFEVLFADPPRDDSPTAVIESTCFRQIEFAGVLRGTDEPEAARQLVDFLVTDEFQRELPLNVFVFPTNERTELSQAFTDFAVIPETSRALDPNDIEANRSDWIDEWTDLVLG
jgi:thiamine transport system substrate-binding protein